MNLLQRSESKSISVLKDPFNKNCIKSVNISYSSGYGSGGYWFGRVDFENGNTHGSQKFKVDRPDGFEAIVKQVDEFIKSI